MMNKLFKYLYNLFFCRFLTKNDVISSKEPKFDKFTIENFTNSETAEEYKIDNSIKDSRIGKNLIYTISCMEKVRDLLGVDLIITSGYRCEELNTTLWGAKNSQHLRGQACDFVSSLTPKETCDKIKNSDLPFDQLIKESSWIHISFVSTRKPRRQYLDLSNQ